MSVGAPTLIGCSFGDTVTFVQLTKGPFCLLSIIYFRYRQVHRSNVYNQILSQNKAEKKLKTSGFRKKRCAPSIQSALFLHLLVIVILFVNWSLFFSFHCVPLPLCCFYFRFVGV
uniref:Uncharacterized protein n=1 Tax=Arundo donax TaxID=35708 RepID=A0A0A9D955_ARUDO